jgi:hypothetical protein
MLSTVDAYSTGEEQYGRIIIRGGGITIIPEPGQPTIRFSLEKEEQSTLRYVIGR